MPYYIIWNLLHFQVFFKTDNVILLNDNVNCFVSRRKVYTLDLK